MSFGAGASASRLLCGALAIGVVAATVPAVRAQGVGLMTGSKQPVTIEANKGVEWRQKDKIYLARGDATATQGKTKIRARTLAAHYRKTGDGNQIWKVTADGNVRITTEKETITAQHAVYIVKTGVFTLTGNNLKLVSEKQTVTASDRIQYNSKTKIAHVIGNATVIEDKKKVRANRFIAYMDEGKDGKTSLRKVDAVGNVTITTETEVLRGDRGDYNGKTKIATLTGNVKLTRGDNQLNGEKAVVDLNTGVSRMVGKVKGVFIPREGEEKKRQERSIKSPLDKQSAKKPDDRKATRKEPEKKTRTAARGRVNALPSSRPRRAD
jgi:lipopolysaccharide export system protein LptA